MDMKMVEVANQLMETEYGKVMLWLCFNLILMIVDIFTGFVQAVANKNIVSGKMGVGILKKLALIVSMIAVVPLTILLPSVVSVSVIIAVYLTESINELVSIGENLGKMGADTTWLKSLLKFLNTYNEKGEKK